MMLLTFHLPTRNGRTKLPHIVYYILEKSYETFCHVVFLEFCKSYNKTTTIGFNIKKTPCVG